jgi:Immunoglobulin V-set domain
VSTGNSQQLQCLSRSDNPTVWLYKASERSFEEYVYRNNQVVDNRRNISISTKYIGGQGLHSLTLNDAQLNDTGYYACISEKDGTKAVFNVIVATITAATTAAAAGIVLMLISRSQLLNY